MESGFAGRVAVSSVLVAAVAVENGFVEIEAVGCVFVETLSAAILLMGAVVGCQWQVGSSSGG